MLEIVFLLIGILLGGAAAWFFLKGKAAASRVLETELRGQINGKDEELSGLRASLQDEKNQKVKAETRQEATEKNLNEQKELIEVMKGEFTNSFSALSSAALKSSSEDFLRLAKEHLGKLMADTKGRLGEHREAMDGMIAPLKDALKKYDEQVHAIELKRKQDYTSLDEQIKGLATTHRDLQKETGSLVTALRKPHVRGRWGEITLRNVVELAGMSSHCDFTEQVTVTSEQGRLRPDMLVHLPGRRDIVVDSKVSLEALLDALSADSEDQRKENLKRHASHVKEHVNSLGGKTYWSQFTKSPELVLLFMSEAALVAALEVEPTIMEDSMSKKVLITTPTTLFALLTAVAYGWRQEQITKNAETIALLGKELYDRVVVWAGHLSDIGRELGQTVKVYNKAVGSLDSRVMPSVRKFKELGATGAQDIPQVKETEETPRLPDIHDNT
jgi:DNA recombination protein RmuC